MVWVRLVMLMQLSISRSLVICQRLELCKGVINSNKILVFRKITLIESSLKELMVAWTCLKLRIRE